MIGQPVTKAFINAGFNVTLLVRNRNLGEKIFGSNIKIIQGNLNDLNGIEKFLDGQERLYLNLSVEPESSKMDFQAEREGLDNVILAAKKTGIKRIGSISSLVHNYQGQNGFDWWVFDIKKQAISKIRNSGLTYSFFILPLLWKHLIKEGTDKAIT